MKYMIHALLLSVCCMVIHGPAHAQSLTYYVDSARPDNTGDGLSWLSAKKTIQSALDSTTTAHQVWVKAGVYPEAITMRTGMKVYGGFNGAEDRPETRNLKANASVIDGSKARAGNLPAYHVVRMDAISSVTLDGFTIKGGKASALSLDAKGAGIMCYNLSGECRIMHCTITGCSAEDYGGGIYAYGSAPLVISDCSIIGCAADEYGGGIYAYGNSQLLIADCLIAGNKAGYGGGIDILYNYNDKAPVIRNCTISGNSSYTGAGIDCRSAAPVIQNCIVSGNTASGGGGMSFTTSRAQVLNCTITDNVASSYGGAIECWEGGSPEVRNTIIAGNAKWAVSARFDYAKPTLIRCLFEGNPGGDYLGLEQKIYPDAMAINLKIPGAKLNFNGAACFQMGETGRWTAAPQADASRDGVTLANAAAHWTPGALAGKLINPNTSQKRQALILDNTTTTILVQSDYLNLVNSGDDYQFIDYHLRNGSDALDRGVMLGAPATDVEGDARPGEDGKVDLGADEAYSAFSPPTAVLAPDSRVKALPLVSYAPSLSVPFDAVEYERPLREVRLYYRRNRGPWVRHPDVATPVSAAGGSWTFNTALTGGDGDYEFYSQAVDIDGNVEPVPPRPDREVVVITSGLAAGRLYVDPDAPGTGIGDSWGNACHSISAALLLSAKYGVGEIWVAEGQYDEAVSMPSCVALYGGFAGYGGAAETSLAQRDIAAHATIIAPTTLEFDPAANRPVVAMDGITGARLDGFTLTGGRPTTYFPGVTCGLYANKLDATSAIANCVITKNQSASGAGIRMVSSSPTLSSCTISNNYGLSGAGGLYLSSSSPVMTHCAITSNSNLGDAAGLYLYQSSPKLLDCVIDENVCRDMYSESSGGGILATDNSAPELTRCMIRKNVYRYGGGVSLSQSNAILTGCVISGNTGHGILSQNSSPTITSCTIAANTTVDWGGGIHCDGGSPTIQNCIVSDNVSSGFGGGMDLRGSGSIQVTNCRVFGNRATSWGGGAYASCGNLTITKSIFAGNTASHGGGAYFDGGKQIASDCWFSGNVATKRGGGVYQYAYSPTLKNCIISGNWAGELAGGIRLSGNTLGCNNCTIADNSAMTSAGGAFIESSSAYLQNTIFAGNAPEAILDLGSSPATRIDSCLFFDHPAGLFVNRTVRGLVRPEEIAVCVANATGIHGSEPKFVMNGPTAVTGRWSGLPTYNAATGRTILPVSESTGLTAGSLAGRIINPDATQRRQAFVTDNTTTCVMVAGDLTAIAQAGDAWKLVDYHLRDGSDALDSGKIAGAPAADLDGDSRPGGDGLVDIGVDEAEAAWAPAVDDRPPSSVVQNAPVYSTTSKFNVTYAAYDSRSGVRCVELFYRRNQGAWTKYVDAGTTITSSTMLFDATITGGDGYYEFYTVATDNAGNVEPAPDLADDATDVLTRYPNDRVYVDPSAQGTGCGKDWANACPTIKAALDLAAICGGREIWAARGVYGEAIVMPSNIAIYGGFEGWSGARESSLAQRNPTRNESVLNGKPDYWHIASHVIEMKSITNARLDGFTIREGEAWNTAGGGVYCENVDGSNVIAHCTVTANIASQYGGGIYCKNSSVVIDGCNIWANGRAGVACDSGTTLSLATAQSPVIRNCTLSGNAAAGIHCLRTSPAITNCLITGNTNGVQCETASPAIVNCTLVENNAAVHSSAGSAPALCNTLVASNNYGVFEADKLTTPTVAYSLFHDNPQADYLDGGMTAVFGAQAITRIVPGARGVVEGSPKFLHDGAKLTSGTWTNAYPSYESNNAYYQPTLSANANLTPNSLVGRLINPNRLQRRTLAIVDNTEDRLDVTYSVPNGLDGKVWTLRDRDDFRPGCGSAAIDAGTSGSTGMEMPVADLDGTPRPVAGAGRYDIGAYEIRTDGAPALVVRPPNRRVDFGEWDLKQGATAPLSIVLENYGFSPLAFTGPGIQLSGAGADRFRFTAQPVTTPLAPGTSRTLNLVFEPGAIKVSSATLNLTTNDPKEPLISLTLSGVGSNAPPAVTTPPAAQTVAPGETIILGVTASGAQPVHYRWSRNGQDLTDDGRISGSSTAELSIRSVTTADAGNYACRLVNDYGSAISSAARVIIKPTLVVISAYGSPSPPVGRTVYTSGTQVYASRPTSEQGFYVDDSHMVRYVFSHWVRTGSQPASSTIPIASFRIDQDTTLTWHFKRQYRLDVLVTPPHAGWTALWGIGGWNDDKSSFFLDEGQAVTLLASPYSSAYDTTIWGGAASGRNSTTTLVMDSPCTVTVAFCKKPCLTSQPTPQNVDSGTSVSFNVQAGGTTPLSYRWKKDGVNLSNDDRISGAESAGLSINPVQVRDAGLYSCEITNTAGTTVSQEARLTVNPALTVVSAHGSPSPAVGAHVYTSNTLVNFTMSGSPEADPSGLSRWVCTGWTAPGFNPAGGSGLNGSIRLNQSATVTWTWKRQHKLVTSVTPAAGGVVMVEGGTLPANGWLDEGASITLSTAPQKGYRFTCWLVDGRFVRSERISLRLDQPHSVCAQFGDSRSGVNDWTMYQN